MRGGEGRQDFHAGSGRRSVAALLGLRTFVYVQTQTLGKIPLGIWSTAWINKPQAFEYDCPRHPQPPGA